MLCHGTCSNLCYVSQAVAAAREGVKQAAARKLAAEVELDNLDGGAAAADASQTEQQLAAAERDERLHENLIRAQQAQVRPRGLNSISTPW